MALLLIISLSGCADYAANTADCVSETPTTTEPSSEGIFYMQHLSGERTEVTRPVNVLFEFETIKFTKYQIAYLSCT